MSSYPVVNPVRTATRDWAEQFGDRYQYAVTLTLKPYRNTFDPRGYPFRQSLTQSIADETFTHFQHRLNGRIFKHAARRYGKTLLIVPVLEGERSKKLMHFHCAIGDVPDRIVAPLFTKLVTWAWHGTDFGNEQTDVQAYRNGWVSYITKEIDDSSTAFDWQHVAVGNKPC